MKKIRPSNLLLEIPDDWEDMTQELVGSNGPCTLACSFIGVGALQFSVATYKSGVRPDFDIPALLELADDFAKSQNLGTHLERIVLEQQLLIVSSSYKVGDRFENIWHVTDRENIALVTYNCEWNDRHVEIETCKDIVRSLNIL